MKIGTCKKGWFIFYLHDWEYKSEYEVWGKYHWLHNVLMAYKGNNLIEINKRFVCRKCGEIHKY